MCVYLNVHFLHTVCLKSVLLRYPPSTSYNVIFKHIHLCFSLHPDTDVLHYSINISRVANYERFLFKRLSGFSKQLFNCSTQHYQCKSRRPCKKKTRFLLTIRYQKRVLHCKSEVSVLSLSTQMLIWIICAQRKRVYH